MAMRRPVPLRILLAAALLGAGLQGCSEEKPPPPPAPRMARVATVHLTAASLGGQASGVVESRYNAQLGFLVGGRLIERKVDIGATVEDGQVLAQLDATDFKNKLAAAQSQLRAAEGEVAQAAPQEERLRTLLKKGYTTQVEYDRAMRNLSTAKARVEEAQANVRLAEDQVAYATLVSDTSGAITAVGADPGQVVTAGQMIVQVSRLDAREGVFSVSEKAAAYLKPGMIIQVALQSDPSIVVDGAVREISPSADPVTRTYQIKVALPAAPEAMRLGAVVTGTLERKGDLVAVIPTGALLQTGEQAAVWVVDTANGTVHRRPVKVLRFDAETVTIDQGLEEGDVIVTAGINSLAEGEKVRLPQEASQ